MEVNTIKVSVIIPVYNDEVYLPDCLESVFNQTLKEIQVICINDGSTDHTSEILEKFSHKHQNMVIVNQNNMGAGKARNVGMAVASGEFIAFMDGDDYYPTDDVLECLYENAIRKNALVCGGSLSWDKKGFIIEKFVKEETIKSSEFNCPFSFTKYIYKRNMLLDNNVKFPDYKVMEDPLFLARVLSCVNEIYTIKKTVYRYRVLIHERRKYTKDIIIDILSSYYHMLNIAVDKRWTGMQEYLIEDFCERFYPYLCRYVCRSDRDVIDQIKKINCVILPEVIKNGREIVEKFSIQAIYEYQKTVQYEIEKFAEEVSKYRAVIIYGAGVAGKIVQAYLNDRIGIKASAFAVTSMEGNDRSFNHVEIKCINQLLDYKNTGLFIIAVAEKSRKEVEDILKKEGVANMYYIDYKLLDDII
ncbi:glycosyltransferase family A protein [Enterocloster bolteae]|uniref:glycosyltransferase family 2 protein n=1 Tax=Enterocloster bolteae TaxID=208479 RepID=UPI002A82ED69|nr:glycosyltransferase family A protein [Enterocloster bolteae]